jgi:hypothetical protein
MKRLRWIALMLMVGLLLNTLIFWGDNRFLAPFMPVFIVALVLLMPRISRRNAKYQGSRSADWRSNR